MTRILFLAAATLVGCGAHSAEVWIMPEGKTAVCKEDEARIAVAEQIDLDADNTRRVIPGREIAEMRRALRDRPAALTGILTPPQKTAAVKTMAGCGVRWEEAGAMCGGIEQARVLATKICGYAESTVRSESWSDGRVRVACANGVRARVRCGP